MRRNVSDSVVIQWIFDGNSMVIRWIFDGNSMDIQLMFDCNSHFFGIIEIQ